MTFDVDYIVPIMQPMDIIPGDTINLKTDFFMRLATPLHPILDNLYFETFYFFVPYRIIWDNFEKFHGAQTDPGDSTDFTVPTLAGSAAATFATYPLWDYMSLKPDAIPNEVGASALPFRAYNLIYNDWFRDENLQDSLMFGAAGGFDDGPDFVTGGSRRYNLMKRGKRHDYLTSCLPFLQKGTSVALPLGTTAPITAQAGWAVGNPLSVVDPDTPGDHVLFGDTGNITMSGSATGTQTLSADLADATAATVNDLRLAFMTQRILENDARTGTRYVEKLLGTWGVRSPDFRLQRPEFLGGGSQRINITPVAQTSGQPTPASDDALGNLAGFGVASGRHGFTQSFVEHGVVLALGNIRGDITYSQGIGRYWHKQTAYDFYYPPLAHIGEQSVPNSEIFWQGGGSPDDTATFGFQERYAEYRFMQGQLTGLFRPEAAQSLSPWLLSEEFPSLPTLGDTFIQSNTGDPLDDAIAIPTEPHVIADFFHNIRAARPLPMFGVPAGLGRL